MRLRYTLGGLVLFLLSCTQDAPPPPAVPPPPEDLSTWTVPELVQPSTLVPAALLPVEPKPTAAEKVYAYVSGTPYVVQVPVGVPVDVLLEPGEQVRNIVGGEHRPPDTPAPHPVAPAPGEALAPEPPPVSARRLDVREGASGMGETLRSHLFLSASESGMQTGVIVTTTKRTYLMDIQSVKKSSIRVVRWTYAGSSADVKPGSHEPGILPDPDMPARYHVGYRILDMPAPPPAWIPMVADDGKKTYLLFSPVVLYTDMPLIREVTSQGVSLLNARQFGSVVIIDKMVPRLELRYGAGEHAEVLTIVRGPLRTIECPDHPECPRWPRRAP